MSDDEMDMMYEDDMDQDEDADENADEEETEEGGGFAIENEYYNAKG